MSVLKRIEEWAQDIPGWWQEALCRITEKNVLEDYDIQDLFQICKASKGLCESSEKVPETRIFKQTGITGGGDTSKVVIQKISEVKHVNALADDQELIFSEQGLTVVYGDNATGKSSYTKILKHLCRARGDVPKVLPNVFEKVTKDEPSALITYATDDNTQDPFLWKNEEENSPLKPVGLFDSTTATQYVERENEIAFRPYGLDLLDKLGRACDSVKEHIRRERSCLSNGKNFNHLLIPDTEVGKLIGSLSSKTKQEDVESLAVVTEDNLHRLKKLPTEIAELKAEDPNKKATNIRLKVKRYEKIKKALAAVNDGLCDENIQQTKQIFNEYLVAKKASDLIRTKAFSDQPLPGVGSNVWRELWDAARRYSNEQAYPGKLFPVIDDALCPLCAQDLRPEARDRLRSFEEFVKDETQEKLAGLKEKLEETRKGITTACKDFQGLADNLDEIEQDSEKLLVAITNFFTDAEKRKDTFLSTLEKISEWPEFPVLSTFPSDDFEDLVTKLEAKAQEFEDAGKSEKLLKLEHELKELDSRKQLFNDKKNIFKEIARLKKDKILEQCELEANTRRISLISGQLTKKFVTEALCKDYEKELNVLGLNHLKISPKTRVKKGNQYHQLKFIDNESVDLGDIVSEGEHRCIALASFLVELAASENLSCIVFDDPVSSLDHRWRNKIAQRLVKESEKRQVIVFTHDMPFLIMLEEAAAKATLNPKVISLIRSASRTGICNDYPPWYSMSVSKRIGFLKNELQGLETTCKTRPENEYQHCARSFYGRLRETWERLVEELLLNGVVHRFGREVQTQRLKKLVDITPDDYAKVEEGMGKCSKFMTGHDKAPELQEPVPLPEEIKKDLEIIDTYRKELSGNKRRRCPRP